MRQLVEQVKFSQQVLNIHHDKCKLLVAVNDEELALAVTVEIHLPVGIAIKGYALVAAVLVCLPACGQLLVLLNVFGAA